MHFHSLQHCNACLLAKALLGTAELGRQQALSNTDPDSETVPGTLPGLPRTLMRTSRHLPVPGSRVTIGHFTEIHLSTAFPDPMSQFQATLILKISKSVENSPKTP